MTNQLYGFTGRYSSKSPSTSLSSALQRYLDPDANSHSHLINHLQTWPPGVDVSSSVAAAAVPSVKRSSDVLYHQNVLDAQNTLGQTEDWYSTSSLVKRYRLEGASTLSVYPQRPGEKDCAHYMQTRTCKFGDSCKFDHPIWVPEGGIPDWKEKQPTMMVCRKASPKGSDSRTFCGLSKEAEWLTLGQQNGCGDMFHVLEGELDTSRDYGYAVPLAAAAESLPERAGEPDCPYFLKTQRCKFGSKCKFNHPKDKLATSGATESIVISVLPERPSEFPCAFYMKTGTCKFGASCKFNHPKDVQKSSSGQDNAKEQIEIVINNSGVTGDVKPALSHNSKGLPLRPDEVDCPFYLKTGSCKYGASCRYNHPDRNAFTPPAAAISNLNIGVGTSAASLYQTLIAQQTLSMLGAAQTVYPQRPGQTECDYYMKTGICKFGDRCKFHHPIDRSESITKPTSEQAVKLTLAGLPRREGAVHCPYYMRTGTCKYGATCKFDHPPPGEVIAITTGQETSPEVGGEVKEVATLQTNTTFRI
ncbi:Zinc finger, CCCH-type [Corchorus olitorius]|uniref:Zinc finger, CCCH-type n=1 Tax=Corchorus olitorius TaxID=93759 RepID=A0A1R3GZY9_9ROSI|nr:Zinc finger, CCCH-type [Corchorus olitorius]